MDGQAEMAPVSQDDVARHLLENPDADRAEDEVDPAPTDDAPSDEDQADPGTDDDSPAADEDQPDAPEQTSGRKFKVTVKGEDGADIEQDVDEKELIAGYTRHSDYTRKTQALAQREEQAVEIVRAEVTKAQTHFTQQAQVALATVQQLAGFKSPQELMQMAQTDPAGYVAEQARMQQVQGVMQNLQHQIQQTQQQQTHQQREEQQKQFSRCWGVIGQKGIDKAKLQSIFETVQKEYDVPPERFSNLSDPALVLIMADAAAYRGLQKQKAEVTKKVAEAPRLPQGRSVPAATTREKRVVDRLRSGRGSRDDLASFIAKHNL